MNNGRGFAMLLLLALLGGCASTKVLPPTFSVEPGGYAAAFDAARDALRSAKFEIDRVDAAAGVISTAPRRSSGLATPWDGQQSSARDELEDLFNHQQRIVRVTFEPAVAPPADPAALRLDTPLGETADLLDLRRYDGPLIARVMVVIEREHRSGWRVETVSIASSSFTTDTELGPRGMAGAYWVPIAQDPALAGRLAAKIVQRFSGRKPSGPAPTPTLPSDG